MNWRDWRVKVLLVTVGLLAVASILNSIAVMRLSP